jgi:hypothetical protein
MLFRQARFLSKSSIHGRLPHNRGANIIEQLPRRVAVAVEVLAQLGLHCREKALHDGLSRNETCLRAPAVPPLSPPRTEVQPGFRNASHSGWLSCEAAIVFIAFPPDEPAAAEAIAAAPWLPGWQASFVPLEAAARKTSVTSDAAGFTIRATGGLGACDAPLTSSVD